MTVREMLEQGSAMLAQAGVPDAGHDAALLLEEACGIDHAAFLADPEREMDAEKAGCYRDLCAARAERIPLQHLTGEQAFMDLNLCTRPGVLIPRWDTEVLVEAVLDWMDEHDTSSLTDGAEQEPCRILDLGCGSGCILISLVHALLKKGPVCGLGIDLSEEAIALARENAERSGVADQTAWEQSDWFSSVNDSGFSVIVSNPPYIPSGVIAGLQPEVSEHEPRLALDGGEDGLDAYRQILAQAPAYLRAGGLLAVEIGYDQGEDVSDLMRENGFLRVQVVRDLAGLDRVVLGEKS